MATGLRHTGFAAGALAVLLLFTTGAGESARSSECTPDAIRQTEEAATLVREGRFSAAVELLQRVVREDPLCPRAHSQLGVVAAFFKLPVSAEYHLGTAIRLAPDDAQVLSDVALAMCVAEQEGGEWLAAKAESLGGRNAYTAMALAMARMSEGDAAGAVPLLREAYALDPGDPFALMFGAILTVVGGPTRGPAAVQRIVDANPGSYIVRGIVGTLHMRGFNDREAMVAEFKIAEGLVPADDELAAFFLARIMCESGEAGAARALLTRWASTFSPGKNASYWLGIALIRAQRTADAVKELELAALTTGSADAHLALGLLKQSEGMQRAARDYYQSAVDRDPRCALAHEGLAVIAEAAGEESFALEHATIASQLDSTLCAAAGIAGELLARDGKVKEGLALLERARRAGWIVPEAHQQLSRVCLDLGLMDESVAAGKVASESVPWDKWSHYNLGAVLSEMGEDEEALQAYIEAVRIDPAFVLALENLGVTYMRLGRFDEAESTFRQAIEANPTGAMSMLKLAGLLNDVGRKTESLEWAERGFAASEHDTTAGIFLAGLYFNGGRPVDAARVMEILATGRPDDLGVLTALGEACVPAGRYERAVEVFERVVESGQARASAYSNLGVAYEKLGRYEDAARVHEQAVLMSPETPQLHYNLGAAYSYLERDTDAEREYRAELAINADHSHALNNLGSILVKRGEVKEATQLIERAIELEPGYVDALGNLAHVRLMDGLAEEAAAIADDALAIEPGHVQALAARGMAAADLGDTDMATEILSDLRARAPGLAELLEKRMKR